MRVGSAHSPFSPDGQTLYSGGYEGRLIFWAAAADAPSSCATIEAHTGWLRSLAVSPDGQRIASCGNDNLVKLWNAADGALLLSLPGHAANVFSVLFHPNGEWLLSGDLLGQVNQWEVQSGKLMRTFDAKELHTYENGQAVHYGGVQHGPLARWQKPRLLGPAQSDESFGGRARSADHGVRLGIGKATPHARRRMPKRSPGASSIIPTAF